MTVYYTGKGDDGTTGVMGKGRMTKDSKLAAALGDVDELNSVLGVAMANITDDRINKLLKVVQNKLFTIGAELSSSVEGGAKLNFSTTADEVKDLEREIDEIGSRLPELKRFVLPDGAAGAAYLHLARSVTRRAERSVVAFFVDQKGGLNKNIVAYLNRLSAFFFVSALYLNKKEGVEESHPTYG